MLLTITLTLVAFELHIKSGQTEARSASLFVAGRSGSGKIGRFSSQVGPRVGGGGVEGLDVFGSVAGLLQWRGVSQHATRQ